MLENRVFGQAVGGANTVLLEYMESCCAESGNRPCAPDRSEEHGDGL